MRFTKELIKFSLSEAAGATYWIIVESLKKGKNDKMVTNKKSNRKHLKINTFIFNKIESTLIGTLNWR